MMALKTCRGICDIVLHVDNVDFGVAQEITLPLRGNTSVTSVSVCGDFSTDPYTMKSTFFKDLPPVIERLPNLLRLAFDAPAVRSLQSNRTIPRSTEMESSFVQHLSRHPSLTCIQFPSGTIWSGIPNILLNQKLWEPTLVSDEQRDWWLTASRIITFPGTLGHPFIGSPGLSSDRSTPESPDSPSPPHPSFDGHNILAEHCKYGDVFILDDEEKLDEDFFGFGSVAHTAQSRSSPTPLQSWTDRSAEGTIFGSSPSLDPNLSSGEDWALVQLSPKFSHDVPPISVRY
ncbi:uncharacterized protein EI90DRAFT_1296148 [Cantharellus anzutake]|uniref:uncharacterized protein n=1 Tax=Cantharellus anzutake TaxID=1750568 RepID=UPI001903606B|nr:uncharacterized protein EI90DRAFT_1296148 [Cantharellus anzutake]KAF8342012.1 hypothetical protein EI90DRAFT_1296148 [Cantharellus anzutake]